jgi:multiple sugar transport system permease protein
MEPTPTAPQEVEPQQPTPRRRRGGRSRREAVLFYLFISPWILGFLAFTLGPMLASLGLSFTQWDLLTPPELIGGTNYIRALNDPSFLQSLKVTWIFTLTSVPLRLAVALFLAILLNEATAGVSIFRTAFYMPAIVASVAAAVVWQWVLNPQFGPVNGLLQVFGIQGPAWFSDPKSALWGLVIVSSWNVGGEMLIFLAGLKGIPQMLYESAQIDGAGRWVRFFRITLPMLSSTIFFNFVMSVIGALQTFDIAFVISTARGGAPGSPLKSTLFYMLYVYTEAFNFGNMGYATAMAWILFVIVLIITLLILRSSSMWVYYESARE